MEIRKKIERFSLTLIPSFLITSVAFAFYLQMHYSLDCYNAYYFDISDAWAGQSRYVSYVICKILMRLGINVVKYQSIFTFVLILSISYCISRMTWLFIDNIRQPVSTCGKFVVWMITLIGFINVYLNEWFLYPDITLYVSIALFLAIEASAELLNEEHGWLRYILSFILMTLSLNAYQATLSLIVTYFIAIMLLKCDFEITLNTLKRIGIGILTIFLSCLPMLIIQKISNHHYERYPTLDIHVIFSNIKDLIAYQKNFWVNQLGFWPSFVLLFFVALFFGNLIYLVFKKQTTYKKVLLLLISLILCFASVYAPHIINSSLWIVPRSIVGFWTVISCGCVMGVVLRNPCKFISWKVYLFCSLAILLINLGSIWGIGRNHFLSNYHDYQYVQNILSYIDDYERESGVEVKYISTCFDQSFQYSYPDVKYVYGDTNTKCFSVEWGDVNAINYYSGKNYIKKSMNPEIYNTFFNRNWDDFLPEEQLFFEGDTLYICFY